jgi:hypothetical protein
MSIGVLYFLGNIQSGKSEKKLYSLGDPGLPGKSGHSPLLIKGTSRREKVRKNLSPPEKTKLAEHSRSRPSTYSKNIQREKRRKNIRTRS